MTSRRTRPVGRVGATLLVAAVLAVSGCGQGTSGGQPGGSSTSGTAGPSTSATTAPRTPTSESSSPSTSSTTRATRSALTQFTPFLRTASAIDAEIRAAAVKVNAGFHGDVIVIPESAARAVRALDPERLARVIPAGAPEQLERAALEIYANLVSRTDALGVGYSDTGPISRTSQEGQEMLADLSNGSTPARNFPTDLAAVRTLAARTPAFAPAAPSSRTAANVFVRARYIDEYNGGCDTHGGWVPRPMPLVEVRWGRTGGVTAPWDGVVGVRQVEDWGIWFDATYLGGHVWSVELNAC